MQTEELIEPLKKTLTGTYWIPPGNRHLTLAFLGDIPASAVDRLIHGFDRAYQAQKRFTYRLTRLCRFPDPGGGFIVLEDKCEGPIKGLWQNTLGLLKSVHLEPDRYTFRPHITLGRIRKPKRVRSATDQKTAIGLDVRKVTLYQSTLTGKGSIYTILKESRLC